MKWEEQASGDWRLLDAEGVLIGAVIFQDIGGKRVWHSVSRRLDHGPDEGELAECKLRLENLWDESGRAA